MVCRYLFEHVFPICFQLEKWGCGIWQDKTFIAEWDRRTAEYEKGKAKTLTLDQLEAKAQRFLAIVRRKIEEIAMAPHNYGTRSRKGALVLDIVDRGRTNILT